MENLSTPLKLFLTVQLVGTSSEKTQYGRLVHNGWTNYQQHFTVQYLCSQEAQKEATHQIIVPLL